MKNVKMGNDFPKTVVPICKKEKDGKLKNATIRWEHHAPGTELYATQTPEGLYLSRTPSEKVKNIFVHRSLKTSRISILFTKAFASRNKYVVIEELGNDQFFVRKASDGEVEIFTSRRLGAGAIDATGSFRITAKMKNAIIEGLIDPVYVVDKTDSLNKVVITAMEREDAKGYKTIEVSNNPQVYLSVEFRRRNELFYRSKTRFEVDSDNRSIILWANTQNCAITGDILDPMGEPLYTARITSTTQQLLGGQNNE